MTDTPTVSDALDVADEHALTRCVIVYAIQDGRIGFASCGDPDELPRHDTQTARIVDEAVRYAMAAKWERVDQ